MLDKKNGRKIKTLSSNRDHVSLKIIYICNINLFKKKIKFKIKVKHTSLPLDYVNVNVLWVYCLLYIYVIT